MYNLNDLIVLFKVLVFCNPRDTNSYNQGGASTQTLIESIVKVGWNLIRETSIL